MGEMTLDEAVVPDTAASGAALDLASAYFSPAMLNHSLRVHLWAAAHGTSQGIRFEPELLYVASVLHDIGLVPEFDNHQLSFEEAGGHVARAFATGAGWQTERAERLSGLVVAHMRGDRTDVSTDAEGYLLARSAGVEIIGRHADDFSPDFRASVLERYPRLGFVEEFLAFFHDQAERKPDSAPAASVQADLDGRMAANPLDERGAGG